MVGCEISGVLLASHKHALVTLVTMVGCWICGDLLQGNAKVCIGQGLKFNWGMGNGGVGWGNGELEKGEWGCGIEGLEISSGGLVLRKN